MRVVINDRTRDAEIGGWVHAKTGAEYKEGDTCVAVETDGRLSAAVLFNEFNGSNVQCHFRCDSRYGFNYAFLYEAFEWAFFDIKATRMTAPVCNNNPRSLRILHKMGFKCEAILKNYYNEGHLYLMTIWPDTCKYLEFHRG